MPSPKKSTKHSIRDFPCARNLGLLRDMGLGHVQKAFTGRFEKGWRLHKDPKKKELDPQEWDFRKVTQKEAAVAAPWEYARESRLVYDALAARFAQNTFPPDSKEWRAANEKSSRLWKKIAYSESLLGWDKSGRETRDWETLFHPGGLQILEMRYPLPWAQFRAEASKPELREMEEVADWTINGIPIRSLYPGEPLESAPSDKEHRIHHIEIDWSFSPGTLKDYFEVWMRSARPPEVGVIKRRGKVNPLGLLNRLRDLAAYRMELAGMNYQTAQKKIVDFMGGKPKGDDRLVVPQFREQEWDTATSRARELLARMFPEQPKPPVGNDTLPPQN